MDKLQMEHPAPLRKPGLSTHFLGFSPSIDYSHRSGAVQYDALHRSLWDHKIAPPHDRIGAEASWLHSGWEQHSDSSGIDTSLKSGVDDAAAAALCRSWDSWDDSAILQHKRRAAEEKRQQQPGGGAPALGMQDCGSLLSDDRSAGAEKTGFLPTVAVSRSRSIPFACKLDVGFATLSARAGFNDEEERYNSGNKPVSAGGFQVKTEVDENPKSVTVDSVGLEARGPLQANVEDGRSHYSLVDMGGREREPRTDELMVKRDIELEGGTVASMGDATIGLKLGKRTYFEDGAAGAGSRAASSSPNSTGNNNNSNNTHITTTSSNKKQKAPRCQAEGCRSDLSSAKEYHRRHKVCPTHSKAGKVRVGNLEQRFCQQCSRFHVLTEFDEGKRSCRRRLAGHNERRRKPQPLAMSLLSSGSFPYQSGDKQLLNSALLEHPYFLQQQQHHHHHHHQQQHHQHQHQHQHQRAPFSSSSLDHAALACQLRFPGAETQVLKLLRIPKEEPATSFPSLELQHFLHGSGTLIGGHGLTLSNPPGAMNLGSEDLSSVSQPPSGISVSGRALSLLSSSLVSQDNPISMSLGVSHHPSLSIEQLLAENQAATSHQIVPSSSAGQPCFTPQSITNSNGSVTGSPDIMDKEPREPPAMSDFDGRSMFIMLQDNNFQGLHGGDSQHGRPILDLMQISSPQSQGSRPASLQQPIEVQYTELEGLRSYESMFGRQNIM